MNTLQITEDFALPLELITMRTASYGDSGSGKTAFGRLVAERVHAARHRFCAIDLKNDWYGLKSSADGMSEGIPVVIFGGPRADVKLFDDASAAATLAETIASIDQSVIIDLDSQSRRRQEIFLNAFLERLYEVNRSPLLLFCDEADRYAPQKPMTQEAILSLGASEDIARRGRKRGIGSFWLTQRTAVLNKNVSEFCNLVAVFRTPGSKDLAELEDRVGRIADKATVKEVVKLAPGLNDGQAFFLSSHPKLRKFLPDPVRPVQLPMPWTFDSSATPGVGHRKREPKVLAKADLVAIESKMAVQVEQARANDPSALRKRIAELEKQVKQQPSAKPVEPKIVEKKIVTDAQIGRVESIAESLKKEGDRRMKAAESMLAGAKDAADKMLSSGRELIQKAAEFQQALVAARHVTTPPIQPVRLIVTPQAATVNRGVVRPRGNSDVDVQDTSSRESLSGPERKILDAYAWWHSIGVERPTRQNIAPLAGYGNVRSAGFRNPLYSLQAAGLIANDALTESGRAAAAWPRSTDSLDAYHEKLKSVMAGPSQRLFDALHSLGGESTRENLAAATGYENVRSAGFRNPLYRISNMGIIEFAKDKVRATSLMYPQSLMERSDSLSE